MTTGPVFDAATVRKINRMSAADVTTLVRVLFNDARVYASAWRGQRSILRLDKVGGFCCEYLGTSHRQRTGVPGDWISAIVLAIDKVEKEGK